MQAYHFNGADQRPNGKLHAPVTGVEAEQAQAAPAGIGHNSGAVDPGPAKDFVDRGPLAIRAGSVPAAKLEAFYEAVRSQGNADVRQAAISNMLARARANRAIKHHDYRLLEQIASCSRWEYRYCCQTNKALAYFAAQAEPKNIGRSLSNLLAAEVIAGVDVPRQIGGWPMTYYTLRCSAEDRSNQTLGNLNEAFKATVSSRQPDDLLPSSRPPDDSKSSSKISQVVPQTTCKSSGGGVASRPTDAQSVNGRSVKEEGGGADAPSLPVHEQPMKGGKTEKASAESQAPSKRGTRLPDDWSLPDEWRPYPRQRGLSERQIDDVAKGLSRYWTTQPGQKGVKLNWSRVWENWIDNQIEKYGLKPAGSSTSTTKPTLPAYWWRDNPAAPRAIGTAGWRTLIAEHGANGSWSVEMLGPPVGEAGCVIPADVIRELGLAGRAGR